MGWFERNSKKAEQLEVLLSGEIFRLSYGTRLISGEWTYAQSKIFSSLLPWRQQPCCRCCRGCCRCCSTKIGKISALGRHCRRRRTAAATTFSRKLVRWSAGRERQSSVTNGLAFWTVLARLPQSFRDDLLPLESLERRIFLKTWGEGEKRVFSTMPAAADPAKYSVSTSKCN